MKEKPSSSPRVPRLSVGSSTRCERRQGPGKCDAWLETTTDGHGNAVTVCPACERRNRGICRDCPRPVSGRRGYATRCENCKALARREQGRVFEDLHREERLVQSRKYYQGHPEKRAAKATYHRALRQAQPDLIKKQKRDAGMKGNAAHEHTLEWHRKNNSKKPRIRKKRRQAMHSYYRTHPNRTVPKCAGCDRWLSWTPLPGGRAGAPPKWCDDCATPGERTRRAKLGRSVAGLVVPPTRKYEPDVYELEKEFGLRTCVTDGCEVVVTGRKKKCSRCKARDAAAALEFLAKVTRQDQTRVAKKRAA